MDGPLHLNHKAIFGQSLACASLTTTTVCNANKHYGWWRNPVFPLHVAQFHIPGCLRIKNKTKRGHTRPICRKYHDTSMVTVQKGWATVSFYCIPWHLAWLWSCNGRWVQWRFTGAEGETCPVVPRLLDWLHQGALLYARDFMYRLPLPKSSHLSLKCRNMRNSGVIAISPNIKMKSGFIPRIFL